MKQQTQVSTSSVITLQVSPAQVIRGKGAIAQAGKNIAHLGQRPLIIGGDRALNLVQPFLNPILQEHDLTAISASHYPDSCEESQQKLQEKVAMHQADLIIGVGGGKALDMAKLVAFQCDLPIVTIPTSGATCAAWTALSNIYTAAGAFQ
ncbi:MAG: iron-containing alcohol dehydrogenase, partial [Cyanobacteria bacterium]|nr:iron-containing alcohol dehydrogenase [Cyanobacteria bacterium GSL.Bin21]